MWDFFGHKARAMGPSFVWPLVGIHFHSQFVFADLANRAIVQEILFDKMLGKKRLMSWPDRFTNTIRCYDDHGSWYEVYRPSVVRNPAQPKKLWLVTIQILAISCTTC